MSNSNTHRGVGQSVAYRTDPRAVRIDAQGEITLRPLVDFREPGGVNPYTRAPVVPHRAAVSPSRNFIRPVPAFLLGTA